MRTNILLLIVLLLGACQVEHTQQWDGVYAGEIRQGMGTEADPYQIASAQELAWLAKETNEGHTFREMYFKLTVDLDMNGGSGEKCFWPGIGGNTLFQGTFDGGSHRITGIRINGKELKYPSGLFGKIGENGKVYDLKVVNAACISYVSIYSGAIAGVNIGTIADCQAFDVECMTGGITGNNLGIVIGCRTGGKLNEVKGGISCDNNGTIRDCLSEAHIFCSKAFAYIGGICGRNSNLIDGCAFVGSVKTDIEGFAGGIAGSQSDKAVIQNSYNRGTVKGERRSAGIACGSEGSVSFIRNCYSAGTGGAPIVSSIITGIENTYYDNRLYHNSWDGIARSSAFLKSDACIRLLNNGVSDGPWGMDTQRKNDGYPILRGINY